MKVVGFGEPERVRVRFIAIERPVLVDVVRDLRASATLAAAETYREVARDETSPIDIRHDRLRALEDLLVQLEGGPADRQGRTVLVGETPLMLDVVRAGAAEGLRRLQQAHNDYANSPVAAMRRTLVDAADIAQAWIVTLANLDEVDRGPDV